MSENEVLSKLWATMLAAFGHRWQSAYGLEPDGVAANVWATALAGLTRAQISAGCKAVIQGGDGWPPSAPEFRALCFGIPSLAIVRHDLLKDSAQRLQFTRLAWEFLDGYAFARADQLRADRMLSDAYQLARDHVLAGGLMPEPVAAAITQGDKPKIVPASPEVAQAHIAGIVAMLKGDPAAPDSRAPTHLDDAA